ncbi:tyrosine-type recombinase/integrase, partial [bacterium]|nr:tyrosine-type recombinase/integrase [bacterium]
MSSAYEYAVENHYVKENPVLRSRMPSFPHNIKKDVPKYSAEQVRRLLLFAKEHDSHIYIFWLLALYTGLRKGELLALTWEDVDYDKKL